MVKKTILLTLCFWVAAFWVSKANAISITNSFTQTVNSYDNPPGIPPGSGSGTNLFPSGSTNTAFLLSVNGNTNNDYYSSYISSNSPDSASYNKDGAEISLGSFSKTWVLYPADYSTDPDSSGYSSATLNYHISGASKVKLSFYYYLQTATVLADWHEVQSDYSAFSSLYLSVNNSPILVKTLSGPDGYLGSGSFYNGWITLSNGSGDLLFDCFTSSGAFGNNGYASAGLRITNITIEAVPLPPSVYLFGSGLVGLLGLRRFKKA